MLIGMFSTITSMGTDIESIDLNAYGRINLKPQCDVYVAHYVSGSKTSVPTICLPFLLKVETYIGFGESIEKWELHEEGPKYELRDGVLLAQSKYALDLAAADSGMTICAAQAAMSYAFNLGFCLTDGILQGSEEYAACETRETEAFIDTLLVCERTMQRRVENAVNEADESIEMFIKAYSGCDGLESMIEVWQDEWDNLIRK